MLAELSVILGLVLLNGLLAGAEIAIVSVNKIRLKQFVEQGRRGARAVDALRNQPERFFAAVQIGITVVGATVGAFGGATFAEHLEPLVPRLPWVGTHTEGVSLALVVGVISILSLILGELVPKSLALRYAETYSLLMGPPILWLSSAARPVVWALTSCSNAVLSIFGDRTTFSETRLSAAELRELVDEAAQTGSLHPAAGEIAARALEFANLTAAEVMVPRTRIVAIEADATPDEVTQMTLEHGFSRFPIYRGQLDEIIGYVMVKDMLALAWEGKLIVLRDLIRPPYFVTEGTQAPTLLQQMRDQRTHLAIVVDEHGGTSGIVTIEDLVEELVGEIFSETAEVGPEPLTLLADGSVIVPGDTPIRDINRELDTELQASSLSSTIGGLCVTLAGRVPRRGDALEAPDGTRFLIEAASERRVIRVQIWPPPSVGEDPSPSTGPKDS
jgi:putative hemolysin